MSRENWGTSRPEATPLTIWALEGKRGEGRAGEGVGRSSRGGERRAGKMGGSGRGGQRRGVGQAEERTVGQVGG